MAEKSTKKKDPPPPSRLPQLPPFDPGSWLAGMHVEAKRPVTRKGKPVPPSGGKKIPAGLQGKVATPAPAAPATGGTGIDPIALLQVVAPDTALPSMFSLLVGGQGGAARVGQSLEGVEQDYGAPEPEDPFAGLAAKYGGGPTSSAAPATGAPVPPELVRVAANTGEAVPFAGLVERYPEPALAAPAAPAVPFGGLVKKYGGGATTAPAGDAYIEADRDFNAPSGDPFAAAANRFYAPPPIVPRGQLPTQPRPADQVTRELPPPSPVDTALRRLEQEGQPVVERQTPRGPLNHAGQAVTGFLGEGIRTLDWANSRKNAFLNGMSRSMASRTQGQAWQQGWGDIGASLGAGIEEVKRSMQSGPSGPLGLRGDQVSLNEFTARLFPALKNVRILDPKALEAAPIAVLEGVEMLTRAIGLKDQADMLGAQIADLNPLQRKTMEQYTVTADRLADFLLDMASDPLNVIDKFGKPLKGYLFKKAPALQRGEDALRGALRDTITLENTANLSQAAAERIVKRVGEGARIAEPLQFIARYARGVVQGRTAKAILKQTEQAIYQDVTAVAEAVEDLRSLQRTASLSPLVGADRAVLIDDWVFHYMDAGSKQADFATAGDVIGAMSKAGYPPDVINRVVGIGQKMKGLDEEFGRRLVKHGILHPDAYQTLRGKHIRYLYSRGSYNAEDILQTLANMTVHGRLIDASVARRRNAELSREIQREIGLVTKATVGFGESAPTVARGARLAEAFDRLEVAGLIRTAPGHVDHIEQIAPANLGRYLGARREVEPGKFVQDLATIGDEVRFVPVGGGEPVVGVIEDIQLGSNNLPLSVNSVRIGDRTFSPDDLRNGSLQKTAGPLRMPEGAATPAELSPVKARMEAAAAEKAAGRDLISQAKQRLAVAESENRQLRAYIEQLRNNEVIQVTGRTSNDLLQDAQVMLRQNEAVTRRLRTIASGGKLDQRTVEVVDTEMKRTGREWLKLDKAVSGERQRLAKFNPDTGQMDKAAIDWEKNTARLKGQIAGQEQRLATLRAKRPADTDTVKLQAWREQMDKRTAALRETRRKLAWYDERSPLGRIPDLQKQMDALEARFYDLQAERRALAEITGVTRLEVTRSADAARLAGMEAERNTLEARFKGVAPESPEALSLRGQIEKLDKQISKAKEKAVPSATYRAEMERLQDAQSEMEEQLALYPDDTPERGRLVSALEDVKARIADAKQKMLSAQLGEATSNATTNVLDQSREIVARQAAPLGTPEDWQREGWVRLTGKEWGRQEGKYAPAGAVALLKKSHGKPPEGLARFATQAVGLFKYVKAPLNPAVHFTNIVGNTLLAETGANLNGLSLINNPGILGEAADEIFSGSGRDFAELNRISNVFRSTNDVVDIIKPKNGKARALTADDLAGGTAGSRIAEGFVNGVMEPGPALARIRAGASGAARAAGRELVEGLPQAASDAWRAPGELFSREEQVYKLALYKLLRRGNPKKGIPGLDPQRAAELTQRYLFDYTDVPQFVEIARKYGVAPFITFPYKASGVLFEALAKKPYLLNRFTILQGHAYEAVEGAREQFPDLAGYIREDAPTLVPVGKDSKGEVIFLDAGRLIPFGYVNDTKNYTPAGILANSVIGAPLVTGTPQIGPIPGTEGFNSNPNLGGRQELQPGMSPEERDAIKRSRLTQAYGHPLAPGGTSFNRLQRGNVPGFPGAFQGATDAGRFAPDQSAWAALAQSVLGIATYVRSGPNAAGVPEAVAGRVREAAPLAQDALREVVVTYNEMQRGTRQRKTYQGLEAETDVARLQGMYSAAEDRLRRLVLDGTISPDAKREKFKNTLNWMFAINERAARAMRSEKAQ